MILYFAASSAGKGDAETLGDVDTVGRMGHKHMLFSYHYFGIEWLADFKEWQRKYKFKLFIDSGAFSAFTSGVSIDINEYIYFLKKLKPHQYAVLDDLTDPDLTLRNQAIMEKAGLHPIPTFHVGEPLKYLDDYMKRYDYIALGGMVGAENLETWLKGVWQHIYRTKPRLKVHGFGLTTQGHIQPYPFYSVDSSSYLAPPRFGVVPLWSPGKKVLYNEDYYKVAPEYKKGTKMSFQDRDKSITMAARSYQTMAKHINEHHKKYKFGHLLKQQTLFT